MVFWRTNLVTALIALSGAAVALAQDIDPDRAVRGVARLSLMNGDVSIRRGDSSELIAATVNAPVMVGDSILTGPQSRAELQLDHSNLLRIGASAEVHVSELGARHYMLQLSSGTVTFRQLRASDAQIELGTPTVAARPSNAGTYRIAVRADGTSEITVRQGSLEVYTPNGGHQQLNEGQIMLARGQTDPEFQVHGAPYEDEWDRWNQSRDGQLENSYAYQYVSPEIYGAEDLDGQGQWVANASYGQVWTPNVTSADWAPYRNGRWVWEDYYGWTWVSYDSWGWAPYHYGRWFWDTSYGWCWWPGARGAHHRWSPALVGFFGFGNGFENIGWVPLAPYEPFHPWWGSEIYGGYRSGGFRGGSFGAGVNLMSTYRNARYEHGVTGVAGSRFGRGVVTPQTMTRVSRGDLMNSGLVSGALPVRPDRASLQVVDRAPRTGFSRGNAGTGRIYSTRQPSQVNRVPFEQQRQTITNSVRSVPAYGWGRINQPAPMVRPSGQSYRPYEPYPAPAPRSYQAPQPSYPGPPAGSSVQVPQYQGRQIQPAPQQQGPQPMRMSPAIVQARPSYPLQRPEQYRQSSPGPGPSRTMQQPRAPSVNRSSGGGGGGGNGRRH